MKYPKEIKKKKNQKYMKNVRTSSDERLIGKTIPVNRMKRRGPPLQNIVFFSRARKSR